MLQPLGLILLNALKLSVPIVVDLKMDPSWGEMEKLVVLYNINYGGFSLSRSSANI